MIVTCERCEQRYKIREEKLPPQGGKIRCPTCRHVFIVRPDGSQGESTESSAATEKPSSGAGEAAKSKESAPKSEDKKPDSKPAPAAKAEEDEDKDTWKLRVSGLTYAFQDLDSLQNWLSARDQVKGIKVARGGDSWKELGDYPDVLNISLMSKFFPMGNVPKTKEGEAAAEPQKAKQETKPAPESAPSSTKASDDKAKAQRKSRQQQRRADARRPRPESKMSPFAMTARARKLLLTAAAVLVLAVVAHFAGWIDFGNVIPGLKEKKSEAIDTSQNAKVSTGTPAPKDKKTTDVAGARPNVGEAGDGPREVTPPKVIYVEGDPEDADQTDPDEVIEAGPTPEEIFAGKLKQGQTFVESRSWAEARAFLEPLMVEQPDDLELNQAMLKVYRGLGLNDEYGDLKKKVKDLERAAKSQE